MRVLWPLWLYLSAAVLKEVSTHSLSLGKDFEMAWLSVLSLPVRESKLRELAHNIAAKCQSAVQARVAGRIGELALAEARGYVRARGSAVIRREVELAVANQPRLQSVHQQLFAMASEAAIRQVVWQALRERKQQRPIVAQELRRAA